MNKKWLVTFVAILTALLSITLVACDGNGDNSDAKSCEGTHTYGGWTVEIPSTCTKEGLRKHECTICEEEETAVSRVQSTVTTLTKTRQITGMTALSAVKRRILKYIIIIYG